MLVRHHAIPPAATPDDGMSPSAGATASATHHAPVTDVNTAKQ